MRLRAAQLGQREALADLDALHRLDAHQRPGEARVEPLLLRRVRAEPRRDAARAHLDDAAERVALGAGRVDRFALAAPSADDGALDRDADLARAAPSPTPPAATIAAVCRALARSSALRTSSSPYFMTPARSAWPGPRQRHRLLALSVGSPSGGQGLMPQVQFLWSRLRTTSASGVPSVRPCRRPASTSTSSVSICCRGLRP